MTRFITSIRSVYPTARKYSLLVSVVIAVLTVLEATRPAAAQVKPPCTSVCQFDYAEANTFCAGEYTLCRGACQHTLA